jgi:PAS domain S-box-containing protein
MIWLSDKEQRATYFNTMWLTATGQSAEKLSGEGWLSLVHPDDREARRKILLAAYESRQEFAIEFRLKHGDGSYRWMLDHGVPLKSEDGEFSGFINSCVDIDDRKNLENRERDARQEAERVNRLKDEFLKTLSHELRTPLTPILGWTKLIRKEQLKPADMDRGLEIIERNIHNQVRLIEDLLDVSRIISGKLIVDFQPIELAEIVESAIAAVRPALEAKGISIQIDKDERFGPVSGDATRIQQIMWNLLSNAAKFTKRGGRVTIKIGNVGSNARITVSDTGEGIDPNFLPHIFSRFTQADSSMSRMHGGLGIGLSIVKQLVELHGGTIKAESPGKGEGSTFTLLLPRRFGEVEKKAAYPVGEIAPLSHSLLKGMRVLIVDDELDSRDFLEFALKTWGATAKSVSCAADALAEIERERPDIVVSDLGMPGEDGFSLLNKIKMKHPNLPVIAVTAYARSEDRKMVLEAGFKDHLSKPVAPGELAAKVAVYWKAQA